MIFAPSAPDRESPAQADLETRPPDSVANPRRTIWTGLAKNDSDRLPAS
jgi:hypothetical protein